MWKANEKVTALFGLSGHITYTLYMYTHIYTQSMYGNTHVTTRSVLSNAQN